MSVIPKGKPQMLHADSFFEFSLNHFIKFGTGVVEEIGYEVIKAGGTEALIVTDRGALRKRDFKRRLLSPLSTREPPQGKPGGAGGRCTEEAI